MTRHVVITGANRGIGLELARHTVSRGDVVFAGCRLPDQAGALREAAPADILPVDVADAESVARFAEGVTAKTSTLDVLINNAGANATAFGARPDQKCALDLDAEHLLAQVRVNAVGSLLMTRALLPLMREGAVVAHMSSQLASMQLGMTMGSDVGYCVAKSALNRLSIAMARELEERGITVVALHPGWVRTDMGGPEAPLSVEKSAAGVIATLDGLGPAQNGAFLNWDGSPHPW